MKREVVQTNKKKGKKKKHLKNQSNPKQTQTSTLTNGQLIPPLLSLAHLPALRSRSMPAERRLFAPPRLRRVRGCAEASSAKRPPRRWEPSSVPRGDRDPAAGIQLVSRVNRMGCFFKTEPVCIAQVELTLLPECFCFHFHILPSIADITVL